MGWTAENLEESPPSLLRWTSKAGTENYGAASFTPVADGCDVEVKITDKTPRAIYAIVEGRRAQSIIRSLLRATLVRFGKKMEECFPEDDQLVADRIAAERAVERVVCDLTIVVPLFTSQEGGRTRVRVKKEVRRL